MKTIAAIDRILETVTALEDSVDNSPSFFAPAT
jgi:hypothetical protein